MVEVRPDKRARLRRVVELLDEGRASAFAEVLEVPRRGGARA